MKNQPLEKTNQEGFQTDDEEILIREEDIKAIEEKLKERLDFEKKDTGEQKEIIKKEIKNYLGEIQETPDFASEISTRDEKEEIAKFPPSQQVGALISLAFEKGLAKAIKVVKEIDNPAIVDEFHDTLVDNYYQELKKRGFIK